MLVETAARTGRSVGEVGQDSFAVTLWTWYELLNLDREAQITRLGERTDLAGMLAVAFHQPQDLQKMEHRYLKAAGRLSKMFSDTRERLTQLADRMDRAQQARRDGQDG